MSCCHELTLSDSGLLTLRMPQRADMDIKPPQHLMDEIDRLLELEQASTCSLGKYLKARLPGLPSAVAAFLSHSPKTVRVSGSMRKPHLHENC